MEFCIKKLNVCRSNFTKQRHQDWTVCIKKVLQFHEKNQTFFCELKYHNSFIFLSVSFLCSFGIELVTQILNNKSKSHQIIFQKLANNHAAKVKTIDKQNKRNTIDIHS